VADGEVVSYVGTPPGGGPGAVLIAHPNAANPVWFSGYLHMTNVKATPNQPVNASTVIGEISRIGADNDHLHFVVYSGQNTRGNLRSFNASINERLSNTTNAPTIETVEPSEVNQSVEPRLITINGTNFEATSIIEVQTPNGQYFTVTPETTASLNVKPARAGCQTMAVMSRRSEASRSHQGNLPQHGAEPNKETTCTCPHPTSRNPKAMTTSSRSATPGSSSR
jgi:hypothetical protein